MIGADGPECGGHPGNQEAELGLVEVDIRPEQLDRAVAAGSGDRQQSIGTVKVDRRLRDKLPAARTDPDGLTGGIAKIEIKVRAVTDGVAADANEDRPGVAIERCAGLECSQYAEDGPVGRNLAAIAAVAVDQPAAKPGGRERIGLATVADRHLGVKAAVR